MVLLFVLTGCSRIPPGPEETGELVVLTLNGPASFYLDTDNEPAGFEHDLVAIFAEGQHWTVRFELADSLEDVQKRMARGEAHVAAAALAAQEDHLGGVKYGPVYESLPQWVVCGSGVRRPRTPAMLAGLRVELTAGSNAEVWAQKQASAVRRAVRSVPEAAGDLLERVANGLADCTVTDVRRLAIERNYLVGLQQAFALPEPRRLAWMVSPYLDSGFTRQLQSFFKQAERDGSLAQLRERYFGHVTRLGELDVLGIQKLRSERLPSLKKFFYEAEQQTGIDWRLLAALAYQESQWDPHARSYTSVRGIMMLTRQTAEQLGVEDRTDPRESILGGARYLQQLRDSVPEAVLEPDRTWYALAAYNVGLGHIYDAMHLTRREGRDPNTWKDLKEVLPLLAKPDIAAKLKHGYARGGEARALTENVRIYFDILQRYEDARSGSSANWLQKLLRNPD